MTDIDYLTVSALAEGRDIYEITGEMIVMSVTIAEDVRMARMHDPAKFPGHPPEAGGYAYWARRIIAGLMDAGWTPPSDETIAVAIEAQRVRSEWFQKHRKDPCGCGHHVNAHIGEGGQCVDCQHLEGGECWTWTPAERDDESGAA